MKLQKLLLLSIFIFSIKVNLLSQNNYSQGTEITCGTQQTDQADLSQYGGKYIPSQGVFKVLVVFVRFKDDNTYNPHWTAGSPPDVMNNFIDPSSNTNSTNLINLTNYFDQMSMGTYNVTGNAIYVETPKNMSDYGYPTPSRINATKDVIQNAVDPLVNFADYDNWTFDSTYHQTNQPDGTVDMIIMVWRGLNFFSYGGEATLGHGIPYTVENGTKTIKNSFYGNGSGITAQDWSERSKKYNFHAVIHEFAHWLLGGKHPYSSGNNYQPDEHAFWGMLRHSGDGLCANAYERERLAWINPVVINSDIINAPLNDYVTTGVAYKYHPVNGASNEYYYFENHQKLSIYDDAAVNTNDKGIFVLHQQDVYNSTNNIRCVTADGNWDWTSTGVASCFGGTSNVRKWKVTGVNRAGYNRRDKLPYTENNVTTWDWIWSIDGLGCAGYPYGDNSNNAFNLTYNDVFSPASNPYTDTWNNIAENFTMEIYNQSGTTLNAHFYLSNPYAGKPSKVQNFSANFNGTHPSFTWDANLEPDLQGYRVYKKLYTVDSGTMTSYISTVLTTYTDNTFTIGSGRFAVDNAEYWVVAVDNSSNLSVNSEHYNTNGTSGIQWKIGIDGKGNILSYKLDQNYPNPFNPTTKIEFQIPQSAFVNLTVYNSLGQRVATLVKSELDVGSYTANFNAGNLPSGIYIYKIQAGKFSEVKKMILIK